VDIERLSDGIVSLRPVTLDEADEWLAGEDDEQIRWFESARPARRADVVAAIDRWTESWYLGGPVRHWGIRNTSSDRLMGGVEVRDLDDGVFNLSYVVFPTFRRRGVATAASRLAIDAARTTLGAHTVRIKILEGNTASLGVAHRLGATEIGQEPSDAGGTFAVFQISWVD
jgi:RimJ/RimL family protein N-acetyltransferase